MKRILSCSVCAIVFAVLTFVSCKKSDSSGLTTDSYAAVYNPDSVDFSIYKTFSVANTLLSIQNGVIPITYITIHPDSTGTTFDIVYTNSGDTSIITEPSIVANFNDSIVITKIKKANSSVDSIVTPNNISNVSFFPYSLNFADILQSSRRFTLVQNTATSDLAVTISVTEGNNTTINYGSYLNNFAKYWPAATFGTSYTGYSYNVHVDTTSPSLSITGKSVIYTIVDLLNANPTNKTLNIIWTGVINGKDIADSTKPNAPAALVANLIKSAPYIKSLQ